MVGAAASVRNTETEDKKLYSIDENESTPVSQRIVKVADAQNTPEKSIENSYTLSPLSPANRTPSSVKESQSKQSRSLARDARAKVAYLLVRGPVTVGIECSDSPTAVLNVTKEAIKHYGLDIFRHHLQHKEDTYASKRISMGVYGMFTK